MNIIEKIEKLNIGEVIKDINLRDYTTYKLEGKALCIVIPDDTRSLIKLIKFLKENNIKYKIIGNGSNLIFNKIYDGVLIKLDSFQNLLLETDEVGNKKLFFSLEKNGKGYNNNSQLFYLNNKNNYNFLYNNEFPQSYITTINSHRIYYSFSSGGSFFTYDNIKHS